MLKKACPFLVIVLLVSLLVGCGGAGEPVTPIKLVPQRAALLEHIDLSRIMADEDLIGFYEEQVQDADEMPQTFDEALDWVKDETGIDLRKPVELLIFGTIPEIPTFEEFGYYDYGELNTQLYMGFIAKCTLDQNALIDAIESAIEEVLPTVEYKGYQIYTSPGMYPENGFEQLGAIEFGFTFIGSDGLVVGSMDAVKDVIDVKEGDQPSVRGELLDVYERLGDAMMKSAEVIPPGLIEGLFGEGLPELPSELPIDISPFFDIKTVASTFDKEGESIILFDQLCFTYSDTAEAVEGLIDLGMMLIELGGMFEGGLGDLLPGDGMWEMPGLNGWATPAPGESPWDIEIPEEFISLIMDILGDLLDNLEVDTSDACLDINFEITITEIEELVETISSIDLGSLTDTSWFFGETDEQVFWTDEDVMQLACAAFYSDTHGGWVEGPPALWGCTDATVCETSGHYYPTAIAHVADHVLTTSWIEYDSQNIFNPLICLEDGTTPATDADIDSHAIWMGLLVNDDGACTSSTGISDRMNVSVLEHESCWYINEVPESASAMNGAGRPGGTYTWVVGNNGYVYGVYKGTDGNWYWGYNGIYP